MGALALDAAFREEAATLAGPKRPASCRAHPPPWPLIYYRASPCDASSTLPKRSKSLAGLTGVSVTRRPNGARADGADDLRARLAQLERKRGALKDSLRSARRTD